MILMPIVYVASMERSQQFYERLGFTTLSSSEWWTEMRAGDGAILALHKADAAELGGTGRIELALVATDRLEAVERQLADVGIEVPHGIEEQPFGRSMIVVDPDGLRIQINEHHSDKYDDGYTVAG
jgi:catechol 2,3-dioxygenase-like lactoylglutathione lyase family enzyme